MIKVKAIYVLLADNEEGEGLCMIYGRGGPDLPAIVTDADRTVEGGRTIEERRQMLEREGRDLAKFGLRNIRLVRFVAREDLEVFHPDGRRERVS